MSFFDQLQHASFGGVPFGVLGAEATFGRRQAVHQYPFKDMRNLQPGESALYRADGKHGQPVNVINAADVNVTALGQ
jgi:prophage DNA circulation protein